MSRHNGHSWLIKPTHSSPGPDADKQHMRSNQPSGGAFFGGAHSGFRSLQKRYTRTAITSWWGRGFWPRTRIGLPAIPANDGFTGRREGLSRVTISKQAGGGCLPVLFWMTPITLPCARLHWSKTSFPDGGKRPEATPVCQIVQAPKATTSEIAATPSKRVIFGRSTHVFAEWQSGHRRRRAGRAG